MILTSGRKRVFLKEKFCISAFRAVHFRLNLQAKFYRNIDYYYIHSRIKKFPDLFCINIFKNSFLDVQYRHLARCSGNETLEFEGDQTSSTLFISKCLIIYVRVLCHSIQNETKSGN